MKAIKTLEEYASRVQEIHANWTNRDTTVDLWYRGQSDVKWDLVPGLYRGFVDPFFERELIRDFKLQATTFLSTTPSQEFEWLFVMQHYGMPTRLLDWTQGYLVALYFAVLNAENLKDACVWILDPWSLNVVSINHQSVPTIDHPELAKYLLDSHPQHFTRQVDGELPVAVRPTRGTPRIVAQKGVFTVHGEPRPGLNTLVASKDVFLTRINVDGSSKKSMLKQLIGAGITHSVLFPELDGLSKEISYRYSNEYLRR